MFRVLLAALLIVASTGTNGAYPEKPIRFVIPSAAGGSPDVLMRILTAELSKRLGVPFVIINKPGANFVIGTMDIVKAPPDGYTLGYGNIVSLAIDYGLMPGVPYEVEKDLTLISNCVRVFNLLAVNNNVPVRSVRELIDYAKKNPGQAGHGLGRQRHDRPSGRGIVQGNDRDFDAARPVSRQFAGDKRRHRRRGARHLRQPVLDHSVYAKAGRVRPLGVSGAQRSPLFPDLPTIAEAGVPGYETIAWGGIIGPAKLPQDIVEKLHREIVAALQSPAVRKRFAELDTETDGSTPREFLDLSRRERPRWAEVIKRSGAKLD